METTSQTERLCPAGLRDLVASTAGMELLPGSHLQDLQAHDQQQLHEHHSQEQQQLREHHSQEQQQSEPASPSLNLQHEAGPHDENFNPGGCVLPPGVPHIQEAPPPLGEQGAQQPPRKRQRAEWVRDAFTRREGAPPNQATCCYCHQDLSTLNVSRMKSHLLNRKVCTYLASEAAQHNLDTSVKEALMLSTMPVAPNGGRSRGHLSQHEHDILRFKMAEMIFHTNLPNEWVEQPTVKDFFAKLRPGFTLLTASELQALRDQAARHQHRETGTQTA